LSFFVYIQEKNRNSEMEKKKINMVSINAILESQMKPGIDANRTLESKALLGP